MEYFLCYILASRQDQQRAEHLTTIVKANRATGETSKLESTALTHNDISVPLIVVACVEEVERRGMNEEGIYRISGTLTSVQYLKEQFDQSKYIFIRSSVARCTD